MKDGRFFVWDTGVGTRRNGEAENGRDMTKARELLPGRRHGSLSLGHRLNLCRRGTSLVFFGSCENGLGGR